MSNRSEIKQRQAEALRAKRGELTQPAQELWDNLVLDPRFDELYRYWSDRGDEEARAAAEVHLYAHNQGVREGWGKLLNFIFQGSPEPSERKDAPNQSIYRQFQTPTGQF